ncbi:MAG: hypothetical protein R2719_05080 [Micropruina sp.]
MDVPVLADVDEFLVAEQHPATGAETLDPLITTVWPRRAGEGVTDAMDASTVRDARQLLVSELEATTTSAYPAGARGRRR